jgi:hypothetical protein
MRFFDMAKDYHVPVSLSPGKLLQAPADQCRCCETVPQMVHLGLGGKILPPELSLPGARQQEMYVTFADPHCAYCDGTGKTIRQVVDHQTAKDKAIKRLKAVAAEIKHSKLDQEIALVEQLLDEVQ